MSHFYETARSATLSTLALVVIWAAAGCGPKSSVPQAADAPADPPLPRPVIRLNQGTFEVSGCDPQVLEKSARIDINWSAFFAVFVDHGPSFNRETHPPIMGTYRIEKDALRFEPKYPLVPGVRYAVVVDSSGFAMGMKAPCGSATAEFVLPKPELPATTLIEQVYPTRNLLPENQLKFYIHFSAPMSRGEAYDHIQLLDGAGKPIESAFLELGEELWDPQGKRFTLFFDPGRIKKGLKPREDLGPVFEEGKSYTLVIDRTWADAGGNPLKETYRKKFSAGAAAAEPIDPTKWQVVSPPADKLDRLSVAFPKPLDHALLHRLLLVIDEAGKTVSGTVQVTDEETRWHFTPERPWKAGNYQLVIDTTLEDLAGNKVGQPFEVDVFQPIQREVKAKTVALPFRVTAAAR